MTLKNRTVMVTGAAGHLGKALAATLRTQGARLVLVDRQPAALQRDYGADADALLASADLLDRGQLGALMSQAIERFGRVDGLCHLAGGFRMGEAVHETLPQTWDFMMDLNARALVNIASVLVPHMIERGGGTIVTVGAAAALKGTANMGAYCASKSALIRLTEAMSAELKDKQINVNCVLPSTLDTPDNRAAMPDADPSRWVAPAALADVIAFLSSDAARAVHGAAVPVTGLV
ncbi:MAG TPA: SDR family NAD(P)-dependent oxidoreductase [Ramlibacter sp.]|nr:SDR family NAD(P)-dependent oxidoreductase [Ramlibacter sp.]